MKEEGIEVPESEWTKGQREFVGSTFQTPKGGVLTVVGVRNGNRRCGKRRSKYILKCSLCSLDEELWGYGSILSEKGNLGIGQIPCGCSKTPRWSENQVKVRVSRTCKDRGFIFNGWVGEYKGATTLLDLEDPSIGLRWKTTNVNGLFSGKVVTGEYVMKSNEHHIKDFISTKKFTKDYVFWRDSGKFWKYKCPKCSEDEYTLNGLCNGIFKSNMDSLKKGCYSCRCSKIFKWTQEQREYQISKVFTDESLGKFLGWKDESGYKNSKSKFVWRCKEGHLSKTTVHSFLNGGIRCRQCWRKKSKELGNGNGYFKGRAEDQDILYIIKIKDKYIKVGRAFNLENRFYKGNTSICKEARIKREDLKLLSCYTGTHQKVYDTEQRIHEELRERGFGYTDETWSTELFERGCEKLVHLLLEKGGLERVK